MCEDCLPVAGEMYSQAVTSSVLPRVERLATGDVEEREDRLQQWLRAAKS